MIRGAASLEELQFDLAHGDGTDLIFETFGFSKRRRCLIPSADGKAVILISVVWCHRTSSFWQEREAELRAEYLLACVLRVVLQGAWLPPLSWLRGIHESLFAGVRWTALFGLSFHAGCLLWVPGPPHGVLGGLRARPSCNSLGRCPSHPPRPPLARV